MHPHSEENPTCQLRLNFPYSEADAGILEQLWICREGNETWTEWRAVPQGVFTEFITPREVISDTICD